MLGPSKPRRLDELITVSLETLVPPDHFYRHLEAKLDLGFVREWARECYADRGRPSIDPVVYCKLQVEFFARFFERVVDLCQEAGLVWGKELFFDATKVEANAAVGSLVPRFYAEATAHVVDLFPDDAAAANRPGDAAADSGPARSDGLLRFPEAAVGAGRPSAETEEPRWDLLGERRLDPSRPSSGSYQRTSAWRVSATDPDATPMRIGGRTSLGYHDHYVVDGGRARIVLAALVTPADVMENAPMRDLLWRIRFRRKLRPRQVTGDTAYGTIENIVAIEAAGIRAYVPLPDFDSRTPFFGKGEFAYDATRDEYRCPQGQPLRRLKTKFTEQEVVYRADAAACNDCPVKAACTASDRGRSVHRSFFADDLDKVRGYHATEAYRRAMRKRQVWVEPLFAEAKDWHGLRRFRLRGLDNVNIEGLLVAAGQNLKRFLAAAGWGRHHAPCGSLVALPKPPHRPIAVLS